MDTTSLDSFEITLQNGLLKVCAMSGLKIELLESPDIEEKWEEFIKSYVEDAVANINDYPQAALGFAAYLGMAVAHYWDKDWSHHKDKHYKKYYGDQGFDNMDDHIVEDVVKLNPEAAKKLRNCILNCTEATLDLLRHESIEIDTEYGFYALVRCYTVLYRIGAAIELSRLGYKKQLLS